MTSTTMRILIRGAIAAGALSIATAGGARPGGEPIYDYTYYDDAAHTTQVGHWAGACYSFGAGVVQYPEGQVTAYYDRERVGWCENGMATWE